MDKIELKALAKINLGLDILGKRPDNYHLVKMVMQTVWLYDRVWIEKTPEEGIHLTSNLYYLPNNEKNIAYRAAKILMEAFDLPGGVNITLDKHIPVAAGLAGGSTDAAAVLFGMNRLFKLNLSTEALMDYGVTLGADVPYCIMRGTVLAEGIGEALTRLHPLPKCYVVLAKPPVNVSTAKVYEAIDGAGRLAHPDIDGLVEALSRDDLRGVAEKMGNVLEQVTEKKYPVITEIKKILMACGALGAMMSGSGPTVFGLFDSRTNARKARSAVMKAGLAGQVYVANVHKVNAGRDKNAR